MEGAGRGRAGEENGWGGGGREEWCISTRTPDHIIFDKDLLFSVFVPVNTTVAQTIDIYVHGTPLLSVRYGASFQSHGETPHRIAITSGPVFVVVHSDQHNTGHGSTASVLRAVEESDS